ncbi:haloacid dehalogenase type II [Sinomonas terrae]|uniref:Haloacid dehalogenase type II n=1 Tax=Sinomonas terrae TaxID=2908838 RepID=A0ABS9U4I3_9MICC|nr:haloacid dehalogenase type II [Sinomonas terrae]MCH6471312.1 haloacid dehalogenase type II [Sinomonas terrae]
MVRRPEVIVFDVNETLSDMSPMGSRFTDVGAPSELAKLWFATLLRDGFALAAAGDNGDFAEIGAEVLRGILRGHELDRSLEDAVRHVMSGMLRLGVHPDVADGIRALAEGGFRLVTLTNGGTLVAEQLLEGAGLRDAFEALLSVADAPLWKPAGASYAYAAASCGVSVEDMMLVAVHPWDVHGAAKAGLQSAWVNRSDAAYPSYFVDPDLVAAGIDGVAEALRAMSESEGSHRNDLDGDNR